MIRPQLNPRRTLVRLYRLPDFFEAYGPEALIVSNVCHVGRTRRPSCGWVAAIPAARLGHSLARLHAAGCSVSIVANEPQKERTQP